MMKWKQKQRGVIVRAGQFEVIKINTGRPDWRDAYHWILSLSWPEFIGLLSGGYLVINLFFAGFL